MRRLREVDIHCVCGWNGRGYGGDPCAACGSTERRAHSPSFRASLSSCEDNAVDWRARCLQAEGERDALLAERHAVCDALQVDNDADAANPASVAMRVVAEVDRMRPVVEAAERAERHLAGGRVEHKRTTDEDRQHNATKSLAAYIALADALDAYRRTETSGGSDRG